MVAHRVIGVNWINSSDPPVSADSMNLALSAQIYSISSDNCHLLAKVFFFKRENLDFGCSNLFRWCCLILVENQATLIAKYKEKNESDIPLSGFGGYVQHINKGN